MILEARHAHLRIAYLNGTLLSPCPVAVVRKPRAGWAPRAFVDFLLSKEGQDIIAGYLMPVRPDVEVRPPVGDPFSDSFPIIKGYNETFLDIGAEFVCDYHECWLDKTHEDLREAWWWVRKANETKNADPNATTYFRWAMGNLTSMSTYIGREDFDRLYNETGNWTDKAEVLSDWENEARMAYGRAKDCARMSIMYAMGKASQEASSVPRARGVEHISPPGGSPRLRGAFYIYGLPRGRRPEDGLAEAQGPEAV